MKKFLIVFLCFLLSLSLVQAEDNKVEVTLQIFSGMPNPSWELSADQLAAFEGMVKSIKRTTLIQPPGMFGSLGYRGFVVTYHNNKKSEQLYIHSRIVKRGAFQLNLVAENQDLENWLLSTSIRAIDKELFSYVESKILAHRTSTTEMLKKLALRSAPVYEPGKWNNDYTTLRRNNCYNYSNNTVTNTFAQPGRGTGKKYSRITGEEVTDAAVRDGLTKLEKKPIIMRDSEGHYIALCIWPRRDYHWYRLDDSGMWSHKPGGTQARDTDRSNEKISDPATCNRGPYTEFWGYFHTVPENITIR